MTTRAHIDALHDSEKAAPHVAKSPIASIFAKATAQMLVKYDEYYQGMMRDMERQQLRIQHALRSEMIQLIPILSHLNARIQQQLECRMKRHQKSNSNDHMNGRDIEMKDVAVAVAVAPSPEPGAPASLSATSDTEAHAEGVPTLKPRAERLFLNIFNLDNGANERNKDKEKESKEQKDDERAEDKDESSVQLQRNVDTFVSFITLHSQQLMLDSSKFVCVCV